MSRFSDPTESEVKAAGRAVVAALNRAGLNSGLVGGLACKLYGNNRCPTDVDIVVLDSVSTQESLKAQIVRNDPNFYLIPAKNPRDTFKVLWYRSPLSSYRSCKVDILQPGIMNIPSVSSDRLNQIDGFPVMPFSVILLLKLQAWTDHQVATKPHLRNKQYTDVRDLNCLLDIAVARGTKPRSKAWLPRSFITASEPRVRRYVELFPLSRSRWARLGYSVPSAPKAAGITPVDFTTYRSTTMNRVASVPTPMARRSIRFATDDDLDGFLFD